MEQHSDLGRFQHQKFSEIELDLLMASQDPIVKQILARGPIDRRVISEEDFNELSSHVAPNYGLGSVSAFELVKDYWNLNNIGNRATSDG